MNHRKHYGATRYWKSDGEPMSEDVTAAIYAKAAQLNLQILQFDGRGLRVATSTLDEHKAADALEDFLESMGEIV